MPFKDDRNHPDPEEGWSPARSQALGADLLPAILQTFEAERP
jgi:murein tripeptide amidase MpaA